MNRRDAISALLALGAAAAPALTSAQSAQTPRRIGTLDNSPEGARASGWAAFRKRLQELGDTESKGIIIESRWARSPADRLQVLAAELVALKPEVIVTTSIPAALAAKRATSSIPIVSIGGGDPITAGLISSYARPEANLTGVSFVVKDIVGKWIELLHEIAPRAKSFAFLTSPNVSTAQTFRELQQRAKSLGLAARMFDGTTRPNVERAFDTMARERVDALILSAAGSMLPQRQQIVDAAARLRIPALYARREYPEAGGLMSYGAEYDALHARAADFVHRILQGARPSELPFEMASTFKLVLNLKTATALGLTIPESVRIRVDEVIR